MQKVSATNCKGFLTVKRVAGGNVELQAVFSKSNKSPVATLSWDALYGALASRVDVHTWANNNLRRIVIDKPNPVFHDKIRAKLTTVRMFFEATPQDSDLMVVKKVDLKKALLLTSRW